MIPIKLSFLKREARDKQILQMHATGHSYREIADAVSIKTSLVSNIIRKNYQSAHSNLEKRNKLIIDGFNNGGSIKQLKKEFGLSDSRIRFILQAGGIFWEPKKRGPLNSEAKIIELFKAGNTLNEICEILDLKGTTVKEYLDANGLKWQKPRVKDFKALAPEIIRLFKDGFSCKEIAIELRMQINVVAGILNQHGFKKQQAYLFQGKLFHNKTAYNEFRESFFKQLYSEYLAGNKISSLANKYKIKEFNIRNHFRKMGFELENKS